MLFGEVDVFALAFLYRLPGAAVRFFLRLCPLCTVLAFSAVAVRGSALERIVPDTANRLDAIVCYDKQYQYGQNAHGKRDSVVVCLIYKQCAKCQCRRRKQFAGKESAAVLSDFAGTEQRQDHIPDNAQSYTRGDVFRPDQNGSNDKHGR